tara:strand:+ start:305 stop:457 length:153 start_codon:yes stop_codon:yes gene_type:complete
VRETERTSARRKIAGLDGTACGALRPAIRNVVDKQRFFLKLLIRFLRTSV